MNKQKCKGFTLMDISIAAAIIGALASTAYPSLSEYYVAMHRTDAKIALQGLAMKLERRYAVDSSYLVDGAIPELGCAQCIFPDQAPLDGTHKFYDVEITAATNHTYLLSAIPIAGSGQETDACGTLTLNSTGAKNADGSGESCWDR